MYLHFYCHSVATSVYVSVKLWFVSQHSKYAPFSDGLPIKKYHDGGELE